MLVKGRVNIECSNYIDGLRTSPAEVEPWRVRREVCSVQGRYDTASGIVHCPLPTLWEVCFNDGARSLTAVVDRLQLKPTLLAKSYLKTKDLERWGESQYKISEKAKKLCRLTRWKWKGLDDRHQQRERVVYAPGAFDTGDPASDPSKRQKTNWAHA